MAMSYAGGCNNLEHLNSSAILHRRAARVIYNLPQYTPTDEVYRHCIWNTISYQYKLHLIKLIYKVLNDEAPRALSHLVNSKPSGYNHKRYNTQGPHSHILMTRRGGGGGEGVRQRFIFYTQKTPNFRICLSKINPYIFKKTQKNPLMFLHQQILLFIFWKAKTCQLQLWWSAGNYFSNRLQSQKYPVMPHKQ